MKISALNSVNLNNISFRGKNQNFASVQPKSNGHVSIPAQFNNAVSSQVKINLDALNKLKEETKEFPKDIEYRKNLLINAGMNPADYYKLRAIIGSEEIKSIMAKYDANEQFYNVGENDANIKSGFLRGNLHIHTQASDGELTVEELLDKAADYANSVVKKRPEFAKEPFTIAITDHDTTESAQKAIKIISENPLKYKNLRVILGTEMTTYNDIAPNIVDEPTSTHVLAYGIDPNEKEYKNFINNTKAGKVLVEQSMLENANKIFKEQTNTNKDIFSLKEAKETSNSLNKNILGICNHMDSYLKMKYAISEIACKNQNIVKILKENNLPTNPDDFMKMINLEFKQQYGNNKPVALLDIPAFIENKTGVKTKEIFDKEFEKSENKSFLEKISKNTNEHYINFEHSEKFHFMPKFEDLYEGLKGQPDAMIGLAHPLKPTWKMQNTDDKIKFLTDFYMKFKEACKDKAWFSEVYYQSYSKKAEDVVQAFLNQMSNVFQLFRTGSADSHGKNIFKRFSR